MPLILLAVIALRELIWPRLARAWRPLALVGLAVLVLPSNLLVYLATVAAVGRRDPAIFLTQTEAAALGWLAAQAPVVHPRRNFPLGRRDMPASLSRRRPSDYQGRAPRCKLRRWI